jgi:hypothetical protein
MWLDNLRLCGPAPIAADWLRDHSNGLEIKPTIDPGGVW